MQQNKQICKYKARAITYEGKRIKTYENNEYFYNEEGVRIKKVTETNKTHEYIVEGSKILYEKYLYFWNNYNISRVIL